MKKQKTITEQKTHAEQKEIDPETLQLQLDKYINEYGSGVVSDVSYEHLYITHLQSLLENLTLETKIIEDTQEMWPSKVPCDVKLKFLSQVHFLSFKTSPIIIAKYIRTLEDLNSNDDGALLFNIQQMFANETDKNPILQHKIIEGNLCVLIFLNPLIHLKNTSFEHLNKESYLKRIRILQNQHRENFFLYRQLVAVKEARKNAKPFPLIYDEAKIVTSEANDDDFEPKPHQLLLEFLLNVAATRGLKKTEHGVYEEVIADLPQHTKTHYYKLQFETFLAWIYHAVGCRAIHNYEWYALTLKSSTPYQMEDILKSSCDPRFPKLQKRRTLFSFQNGIFDCKTGYFHLFYRDPSEQYQRHVDELKSDESSSNYFDFAVPLEYFAKDFDINNIHTPTWDHIYIDQKFDSSTMHWSEAFFGRLCFDVGECDNWGLGTAYVGVAGSGKSTLVKEFITGIYEKSDIGYIMDDCEQNFTDQHLRNVNVVAGLDVTTEIKVSSARFNQWITGEDLTINIKNKEALSQKWRAHVIIASNEYPGIKSKAGSGGRRFAIFTFNYAVKNTDTRMSAKLKKELPPYLIKCVLRYRKKVKKYGDQSLWEKKPYPKQKESILPKMLHDNKRTYMSQSSFPDAFLDSTFVEFHEGYECTKLQLKNAYDHFVSQNYKKQNGKNHRHPEACTPLNFAYSLQAYNCEWDVATNKICGLRVTTQQQQQQQQQPMEENKVVFDNSSKGMEDTSTTFGQQ